MKYEPYTEVKFTHDYNIFDFLSTGKKGIILKRVAFTKTETIGVYNLEFGDVDENDEIDDCSVTDNGDRNKVLATVVDIVGAYSKRFPDRALLFRGSTDERTRLYRMAISLHLEELSSTYEIQGYNDDKWLPFVKDLKVCAFLIKRKKP